MQFAFIVLLFAFLVTYCSFALRKSPLSPVRTPLSICAAGLAVIGMTGPVSFNVLLTGSGLIPFLWAMGFCTLVTILILILEWMYPGTILDREYPPPRQRHKPRNDYKPPKPPPEPSRQHRDVNIDELRARMRGEQFRDW